MSVLRRVEALVRRRVDPNERGMVTAFVTIMSITLVATAVFSWEVGGALADRRRAFSVAQAAARAAVQVDEGILRSGAPIVFTGSELSAAQARARDYLAQQAPCSSPGVCTISISTGPTLNSIEVRVSWQESVFGNQITIGSTGTASAQRGVLQGN
jgi:hypothetical protein